MSMIYKQSKQNTIDQNVNCKSLGRTSISDFYVLFYTLLSLHLPSFLSTTNMYYIGSWASCKNKLYIPLNFLPPILTEWKKTIFQSCKEELFSIVNVLVYLIH